jgi:exonuclease III
MMADTKQMIQLIPISIPKTISKCELSIISWNIHDAKDSIEGLKTEQDEVANILMTSSIFCLQETKREVHFPNYLCFNQLRKDSRSGGLCIGIHRSISDNAKLLRTKYEDIQAVSITPDPSNPETKFTLINVYDSPENSSFKIKKRVLHQDQMSTLEQLTDFLANNDLGEVIMVGDFNARTNDLNFEWEESNSDSSPEPTMFMRSHPEKTCRISKDSVTNTRGKLLIDFMACSNMTIINGNMVGDIFGEFTCHNYNGCSVVDYVSTTQGLFQLVSRFEVMDLTSHSDHKPCKCVVKTKNDFISPDWILNTLEDTQTKFKWDHEQNATRTQFVKAQANETIKNKIDALSEAICCSEKDIYKMNDAVVDIYRDLAENAMPRKPTRKPQTKKTTKHRANPKNPWFDTNCIILKRDLKRLAKDHGNFPRNINITNNYYTKRREYKILVRTKKDKFFAELSQDVELGKNIN